MKVTHDPHGAWQRPTAVLDADYEAEVRRSTERGERLYQQAQRRAEAAQRRLARAQAQLRAAEAAMARGRDVTRLRKLVKARQAQLEECRRLMQLPPMPVLDRQVRLRTGLDDHLELGMPVRPDTERPPVAPVTVSRLDARQPGRHRRPDAWLPS